MVLRIQLNHENTDVELGHIDIKLLNNNGKLIITFGRTISHSFGDLKLNFLFCEFSSQQTQTQTEYYYNKYLFFF